MAEALLDIPLLDLAATPEQQLVLQLREACARRGFFLVKGHGVPQDLVDAALAQAEAFFTLPAASKLALRHNAHAKGYMPWGEQTLDKAAQACGDTKETWAAMDEALSVESPLPFHSPNQWPDEALVPGFRPTMQQLVVHMKALRDRVNRLMAQALGQPPGFFEPFFQPAPLDMLRAFHYHSAGGSSPDSGVFGAGAHTDWGHITYLMTDGCPGLQIELEGAWLDLPHVPGAFVCNIADLLQLWSCGRFSSTKHRVVIAPGVHRFSCAYFTVPAWDAWVRPLQLGAQLSIPEPSSSQDDNGNEGAGDPKAASGVVVTAHGCSLAPGTDKVQVLEYIQAKYSFHFAAAGDPSQA